MHKLIDLIFWKNSNSTEKGCLSGIKLKIDLFIIYIPAFTKPSDKVPSFSLKPINLFLLSISIVPYLFIFSIFVATIVQLLFIL